MDVGASAEKGEVQPDEDDVKYYVRPFSRAMLKGDAQDQ